MVERRLIEAEAIAAYRLETAVAPAGPLVFASPHSGRHYPLRFMRQSQLSSREIRRGEDALVDQLLGGVAALGVPVLCATYARAYLDLNRDPGELDPAMFAGGLPAGNLRASERVAVGLGVLPRDVAPGRPIYARALPPGEAALRIEEAHTPFHDTLARLLEAARARHGYAILVDCHSMPAPVGPHAPAIVIGDLHGRAAAPALVDLVAALFTARGHSVARNAPYAGAYTLERHGVPAAGLHAVQIEIDRALYLDQERLAPAPGFAAVAETMRWFARSLLAGVEALRLAPELRLAAE